MVISSGSSAISFTPLGMETEARLIVSLILHLGDVHDDLLRDLRSAVPRR